ncbi:MAG: HAD family hydrolase [bacterium]|nr:HAD family hydrolase [bacterium]
MTKRILIDLDGVLNNYEKDKYDENFIPKMKDGAYEFLEKLSQQAELYLFTSRNLMLSVKWLIENKLDSFFKDVTNVKLSSFLYIDDRAMTFNGNYQKTLQEINSFEVYWEN